MTQAKVTFCWVLHQHQPVGNFPWVFAQVYDICYLPLIDALERHPHIRVTMHYSGPLLDWLLVEHPDYVHRLSTLASRGQIEVMTGGYYEPILPILPEFDQIGQIMKMNNAVQRHFNYTPTGLWLAERVWEPTLPSVLNRSNVRYTVLDDTHFLMAGLTAKDLYGYYVTEDQGFLLNVVPNPKIMRELIPWQSVEQVEASFKDLADVAHGKPRLIVLADDGEKFGSWPGTHEYIWENGYMERFLAMLERNSDWLETAHVSEYLNRQPPLGRVYIPTASYAEMMEWSLPTERQLEYIQAYKELQHQNQQLALSFVHGSFWRNFAAKYPEANNFHKKMLRVHNKIRSAAAIIGPARTQEALDQLWQGQCNCGYWHGVFGGLYLSDIRSAIYQHLIHAEAIVDIAQATHDLTVSRIDFDCDGHDELLIEGPSMDVYIAPHEGGSIFEWDYKPTPFNVVDTLARRAEAYHDKLLHSTVLIVPSTVSGQSESRPAAQQNTDAVTSIHDTVLAKEAGLQHLLHYDPFRRTVLRERFFTAATTLTDIANNTYQELGDFFGGLFDYRVEGGGTGTIVVDMWRDGSLQLSDGIVSLRLRKVISLVPNSAEIRVNYTLHNTNASPIHVRFGIDTNWGMLGGGHNPNALYTINDQQPAQDAHLDSTGEDTGIFATGLHNTTVGINVSLLPGIPADIWRYPIETVSNSEAGFERTYQCSSVLLHWPIDILPNDRWSVTLRMTIDHD